MFGWWTDWQMDRQLDGWMDRWTGAGRDGLTIACVGADKQVQIPVHVESPWPGILRTACASGLGPLMLLVAHQPHSPGGNRPVPPGTRNPCADSCLNLEHPGGGMSGPL